MNNESLRKHLANMLDWQNAHIGFQEVLAQVPMDKLNTKVEGVPHSIWEIFEHMRISQKDILDFTLNHNYVEMEWPKDYWPSNQISSIKEWDDTISNFFRDLGHLQKIALDLNWDLTAPLIYAPDYSILRELLLVADHNNYHLGQIVILKQALLSLNTQRKD